MNNQNSQDRDLVLLEQIEKNPDATQASLASQIGVAVGTVNWHLKRLIEKGYVKVKHAERRKLKYIITPEGIALRANLTLDYIRTSLELYRLIRKRVQEAVEQIQERGYSKVYIEGSVADIVDICRLTCIEQEIEISEETHNVPILRIEHLKIHVDWSKIE